MSEDETRRMLELLPGSRLAEIPDAGHDVHLDQPDHWHAVLGEFLTGLDR
jgi:pimeloyl-ACP methyl ester carboxylesterase